MASLAVSMVPEFSREQVMARGVLHQFLNQLLARSPKPSQPLQMAVTTLVHSANNLPTLTSPTALAELTKTDPAASAFLQGLGLFDQGKLEEAAAQFRASLRTASDFYPAMFYLGACYAAGHRDKEAVGAWQTALITQGDMQIVYLVLTDAWLRLRDPGRATDFLDEATEHWPQEPLLVKRRIAATLMAGQAESALATIDRLLLQQQADADLLFAGIHLLHDALLAKQPIVSAEDDRGRAQHYGEAYRALNGPQQEQVKQWLGEVKAR
jgi:tetratricopeptide (TPR) repeat protein